MIKKDALQMRKETEEKVLNYFFRLDKENQDLILYEMIDLYRKQEKDLDK